MRIDDIPQLEAKCTGCMACVDACPAKCVSARAGEDGFLYSAINQEGCIHCGRCYAVCPLVNWQKHDEAQHLFACYSTLPGGQNRGSSGGMFELLATHFLEQGYHVCGAAFDGLELKHHIIRTKEELPSLLKSKYVQSNMEGIYAQVRDLLKKGERVFFCGTPCQVSAMLNSQPRGLRQQLLTADIICHGVPSQKTFDHYIQSLEEQHGGKVTEFSFRVKDNRYRHAHGYRYTVEKGGKPAVFNGVYTQSSFYNAFKNYNIFRAGCYDCQYCTLQRVSDLTLGDFWGIEKYDFHADTDTDAGISMVITHTERGLEAFSAIQGQTISKEFPVAYGVESNHCLTQRTRKPGNRDAVIQSLCEYGYEATAQKYFKSGFIYKIYWLIPPVFRNLARKLRSWK